MVESRRGLRKAEEIEVLEEGGRVLLFHRAAAGAKRISPLGLAGGLYENRAAAYGIGAMPALTGFHQHVPRSSLARPDGGTV